MKIFHLAILLSGLFLVLFSFGCSKKNSSGAAPSFATLTFPEEQKPSDDLQALSLDSLRNALVTTADYGSVRLVDGEYSVDSLRLSITFIGGFVYVDLDADGHKDAIGSLSMNTGGTGSFNSMDVFLNRNGTAFHSASYEIGDREKIDSLRIHGDTLDVFFLVHGPGDPMSSPSVTEERKLLLVGGRITEIK